MKLVPGESEGNFHQPWRREGEGYERNGGSGQNDGKGVCPHTPSQEHPSPSPRRVSLPLPFNDLEALRENADQLVQGSRDTSFPQHQNAKLTTKSICNNLCLQDVGYSPCKCPQRHAVSYRKSPLWMWHQSWEEDWDPHVSRSPPSLGSSDNVSSSFPPPEQIATLPRPLLKQFATLTVPREAAEKQKAEKQRMQRTNGPGRLQGMEQASTSSERLLLWPLPQPPVCCHSF